MRAEAQGDDSAAGAEIGTAQASPEEHMEPELRSEEGTEGLAGSAGFRSQKRAAVMRASTGLRRKWREGKSSPYTGKLSARPAGKPGDFLIAKEGLRRSLPRHCSPQLQRTILGAQYAFWKAWRNLSGPMGFQNQNQTLGWDQTASRWSAPGPGKRTCREDHAPSHRPQMSSDRLFLDRVARQHCPSPLHRHAQTTMHPRPARLKQDISTLQRIGHFYFALTWLCLGLSQQSSNDRIAPHDCRRTCAKLCRATGGGMEQIPDRPVFVAPLL